VIYPDVPVFFRADVLVHDSMLDLTLQPLDGLTKLPTGDAWNVTDVAIGSDGGFTASFGTRALPAAAYPLLNDPVLTLHDLTLTGEITSMDSFCGGVVGYAQVFGSSPSDRIGIGGSTFGAVRITADALPTPVSACISAAP